ncbi:MAG: BTAD domain-containing putative transcriptional regulator [Pseudomonadota bacterium]
MNRVESIGSTLRLSAFGVTSVSVEGETGPVDAALGMKALAMIAYLADAAPRPVTRDALVDLLWDRVSPAQGKGSLRQEIRRIKRALGDDVFRRVFTVTDNHIAANDNAIAYDVADAQAAAGSEDPDSIAALLALYRGDFLSDNSARAETFQQWAGERREYLKDMIIAALSRLGALDLSAGRIERAQEVADRIVTVDGLHETGHEIMIRCHIASGRRAQARAHYERFRALMLRELAAEPRDELAALVSPEAAAAPRTPIELPTNKSRPTIAVLNVSAQAGADQAYLADGVVEQLVANLSKSTWIKVAALNVSPYAPLSDDVERAQRNVRDYADYILRVDVRVVESRVSITATLNRVLDSETVFSDQMDDNVEDLLELQRRVALRIASIFEPMVLDAESEQASEIEFDQPVDLDHWRLLMRARWLFWTTTPNNNLEARRLLTRALEMQSNDVPTLCVMALSHMLDGWSDWSDDVEGSVREAQRWAQKAVRVAPNDGWAQFSLGVVSSTHDQIGAARSRIAHALRLSPSLVIAVGELARLNVFCGATDDARRLADEALALSPYDQQNGLWIRSKAIASWIEGDLDEALDLIDYALIVRPGWFQNHVLRAVVLAEQGDTAAAAVAWARGKERVGDYSIAAMRIGHPFQDAALFARFVAGLNKAGADYQI